MYKYNLKLIAPSGYSSGEKVNLALENWQNLGHDIYNISSASRSYLRFGGEDKDRIQDLQLNNIINKQQVINIVMPVRGGYGLSRILDDITWHKVADNINKYHLKVIGHSDFTLFNLALYALTNTVSYAGPMFTSDFSAENIKELNPYMLEAFNDAMQNKQLNYKIQIKKSNDNCVAEIKNAILWGGNLTMICSLIGSKYLPCIKNGILFIEDINEHPYRIERMLHQLYHAQILQKQCAIIFADFSGYKLTSYDNSYNLHTVYDYWTKKLSLYKVKIFYGLSFGHIANKATLPFGAKASINYIQEDYILSIQNSLD